MNKKMNYFNSFDLNFKEIEGKLVGIACPVNKYTDDIRCVKFSKEFLASNLNKTVPLFTDHEQVSKAIIGKAIFTKIDDTYLYFEAELYMENPIVKDFLIKPLKDGVLKGVSIGIENCEYGIDKDLQKQKKYGEIITKGDIHELSLTPRPAFKDAKIKKVFSTASYQDLPLASRDRAWDSGQAISRIREYTGSDEEPSPDYKRCFFWYDKENEGNFGAYKLPFVDVIYGELYAIPRAIFAVAGVLRGARGGVDIPEKDRAKVIENVNRYYEKMDLESPLFKSFQDEINEFSTEKEISSYFKIWGFNKEQIDSLFYKMRELYKKGNPEMSLILNKNIENLKQIISIMGEKK